MFINISKVPVFSLESYSFPTLLLLLLNTIFEQLNRYTWETTNCFPQARNIFVLLLFFSFYVFITYDFITYSSYNITCRFLFVYYYNLFSRENILYIIFFTTLFFRMKLAHFIILVVRVINGWFFGLRSILVMYESMIN